MYELKKSVKQLAVEELERANKRFPMFQSQHEGYAVLKEEIEETQHELKVVSDLLERMWDDIKLDLPDNILFSYTDYIKEHAINAASEAIQVAAMAQKFKDSFKGE